MTNIFNPQVVYNLMRQVYDYQVHNLVRTVVRRTGKLRYIQDTDWERGVFWAATAQAWTETQDAVYLTGLKDYSLHTGFRPGPQPRYADAQVCIQAYLDIYPEFAQEDLLTYSLAHIDYMVNNPRPGNEDWFWCDALFMAPPSFFGLSKIIGDRKYADYAHKAYWESFNALWDAETNLVYRDARYIPNKEQSELREANGEKVFWTRGLGWVLASVPRIFRYLDSSNSTDEQSKAQFLDYFKKLAKAIAVYQHEDGFWRASILDPQSFPAPESSGTALLTYGLAWGYNQGHLDESYLPIIIKGWQALIQSIHPNGMIGWVQLPAFNPRPVKFSDNIEYGAGAFLLAGCEIAKLDQQKVNKYLHGE